MPGPVSLRWFPIALASLVALGIATLEYRGLGNLDTEILAAGAPSELHSGPPWGGLAGRRVSAVVETHWRKDPEAAETFLAWHLQRYPVDHSRWYHRAIIARDLNHDPERVFAHLEAAVAVQPGNREGRWRAATLAQLLGRPDLAASHLRYWLQGQPGATGQALFAAGRWIGDPDTLLDLVVPETEGHLLAVLRFAREHGRVDLAQSAWSRLPRPRLPGDEGLLDLVDLLLAVGHHGMAMAAWSETYPDYRPCQVPNGDFQHPFHSARGLDWDTRMSAGRASRDTQRFITEPASLRLDFDGNETLRLGRPAVRIPVTANPEGWVLTGYWRGDQLTTRALPYLSIRYGDGGRVRIDVPARTFDWVPFRIEIEGSDATTLLHLQLQRDPSSHHFDRFLAGTLWLDGLGLAARAPAQ